MLESECECRLQKYTADLVCVPSSDAVGCLLAGGRGESSLSAASASTLASLQKALSDWQSSGHDDLLVYQIGWPLRNQKLTLLSPRKRWSAKERLVSAHRPPPPLPAFPLSYLHTESGTAGTATRSTLSCQPQRQTRLSHLQKLSN